MRKTLLIFMILAVAINCTASYSVTEAYHNALELLLCNEAEDILLGNIARSSDRSVIDLISLGKLRANPSGCCGFFLCQTRSYFSKCRFN